MKRSLFLIPFIFALIVSSCGVIREGQRQAPKSPTPPSTTPAITVSEETPSMTAVQDQLQSAHAQWRGTPYVLGGSSRSGIDCSAFTQTVFREYFDAPLPRNTREQLQVGSGIRRQLIRPGDLVFFRTARNVLHVGIAMEDGDFLHASVSNGVMISNLSDSYWAGRYLGARRVL
ncbi:MAG: C40 family peptidase [Balneolaceae bacterium]|nr:C40 family peptidase [Balneolaceae bacterium]